MEIGRICVLGAGRMGRGIAQVAAMHGFEVQLQDTTETQLKTALDLIRESLEEDADKIMARVKVSRSLQDASEGTGLVVEALPEDLTLKQRVLKELDGICQPDTIIATTTCTLSVSEIVSTLRRRERCLGMHFYYPVTQTNLVEMVLGEETSEATCEAARTVIDRMGKTAVRMKESPLHIMNRTLAAIINEACFMVMEELSDVPDIDSAMKFGTNWPKGPFEFADEIGLDTILNYLEVLQREIGDPKYRPCPLLRRKVRAGYLGRSVGQGFYRY